MLPASSHSRRYTGEQDAEQFTGCEKSADVIQNVMSYVAECRTCVISTNVPQLLIPVLIYNGDLVQVLTCEEYLSVR